MEDKITNLLVSTDKALKELYVNFIQYKDAKNLHDLQAKNQIKNEYVDYENIRNDFIKLKQSYDDLTSKNEIIKTKILTLKNKLKTIVDKNKLD